MWRSVNPRFRLSTNPGQSNVRDLRFGFTDGCDEGWDFIKITGGRNWTQICVDMTLNYT